MKKRKKKHLMISKRRVCRCKVTDNRVYEYQHHPPLVVISCLWHQITAW